MSNHRTWKEVRAERIKTPEDEARVEVAKAELVAEVRAHRLAELRKQHGPDFGDERHLLC